MSKKEYYPSKQYRITIRETITSPFADWIDDMTLTNQDNGETILIGSFTDQPALRGFLEELWNLNLTVITVERIENEN